jgi:signal transduction histidine kinase
VRRRLLYATISAVLAAVVLLGVPLAIAAAQSVRDGSRTQLDARAVTVARALEARYINEETISDAILESYVGGKKSPAAYILVTLPTGENFGAGSPPDRALATEYVSKSGLKIEMEISWWDVFWSAARAVLLVLGAGLVAIAAGVAVAVRQAGRLSEPLVLLAASAEQLGSGHSRPRIEKSGVEEIDLVAEELMRSGERMAARLASERQFSSDASHQLRTPLTSLSMRLEEISSTTTQEGVRAEAEAALVQVERLVGVVDDLLGRTRKALGSSTEAVALGKVLRQQREEWALAFESAGRTLTVGRADATVFATPGGLAQVLATLIENSLAHGAGTTSVTVRESGATNAIVIEVSDEGAGVPVELAPRIFEREVTSGRGTGLGLALARDLVAADGGRLELSQRAPAVFSVFLQAVPRMVDIEKVVPHSATLRRGKATRRRGRR